MQIVPKRLQESYRQIMDQGKQVKAHLYYQEIQSLRKLWFNLIQLRTYGHQPKSCNAQPRRADHTVSRLYTVESTPGTGGSLNQTTQTLMHHN